MLFTLYEKFKNIFVTKIKPPNHNKPQVEKILSVPKDSLILCSNFHAVARVNRDIYKYDREYQSAFTFLENQPIPIKGQLENPACYCGAQWFDVKRSKLIMDPVTMQ